MIKIFIGAGDGEDRWIEQILLYTLFKNTKEKLDITFLRPNKFPDWRRNGWGTPFTCFRYAIPELCNFKGKAIYLDVDQMNFKDIAELYETDLNYNAFGMVWDGLHDNGTSWAQTEYAKGWFCDSVLLIDCERAKEHILPIDRIKAFANNYKHTFINGMGCPHKEKVEGIIKELNPRWNSFDGRDTSWFHPSIMPYDGTGNIDHDGIPQFEIDEICHLHFTSLSSQPWHPIYTPWGKVSYPRDDIAELLWDAAIKCKMISNPEEL